MPAWLKGFKARWPDVRCSLWSGNSDDVIERLEKRLVEVGLIREPYDGEKFESLHIMDEPWTVLMRADHPLAGADSLTLDMLAGEELIVPIRRSGEVAHWFADAGLEANIFCQYAPLISGVILAEQGMGVAIAPASARVLLSGRPLVSRPLSSVPASGVALIWPGDTRLSAPAAKFVDYVKSCQA